MGYFKKDGDLILVDVPYAEAYIPKDLFGDPESNSTPALFYGDGVKVIGNFTMRFFDSDEQKRESVPLKTFNYPNSIETKPDEIVSKELQLSPDMEPDKYYILKYYKGDIMMYDKVKKSSQNCERFLDFLSAGKMPRGIDYDDLFFIWIKNFKINNVNSGVPSVTLQLILSENCRFIDDPVKQFRKIIGKNDSTAVNTDYQMCNLRKVAGYSAVMNALVFECFGEMLTTSLTMSKNNTKQNRSPVEEVLTM